MHFNVLLNPFLCRHRTEGGCDAIRCRYTEFLAACLDWKRVASEGALQSAFDFFDADGSGTIDRAELAAVLGDEETNVRAGEHGTRAEKWQPLFPAQNLAWRTICAYCATEGILSFPTFLVSFYVKIDATKMV